MIDFKKLFCKLIKPCTGGKSEDLDKVAVPQEQKIFTLQSLIFATNNFENKLGQGGFGPVFKVTLLDWWLTSPETTDDATTLGVAGLTSQQSRAVRCFSSAPILKIYDLFELETVDGVTVILQGFINKDRTLQNGFHPQVFDHFIIGFPPNWKEFSTKRPKIESVLTGEGGDSIKGSYTVDMGVEDGTPLNPSSVEIPHEEHIVEAGNEVLSPGFEDDQSLNKSSITGSKSLGSRRMTRSMKKTGNSKTSFPLVNDMISNLDPEALAVNDVDIKSESSTKFVSGKGMKSKRQRINQNVDIKTSQTGISNQGRISDLEEKHSFIGSILSHLSIDFLFN